MAKVKNKFSFNGYIDDNTPVFLDEKGNPFKDATPKQKKELKNQKPIFEVFSWNPT